MPTLLMLRAPGETSHRNWTPIFFVWSVRRAAPCVCVHLCIHGPQKNLKSSSLFPSTPQRRRGRHTQAAAFLAVAPRKQMGRAPCCGKVGLKKGRWTREEDEILARYIEEHGEGSWRSLPKNAGTWIERPIDSEEMKREMVEMLHAQKASSLFANELRRLICGQSLSLCRVAAVREELQAAVDQLPSAGAEARHVLPGGGGDGDEPPRHARQQVSTIPRAALQLGTIPLHAKMIESTRHTQFSTFPCLSSSRLCEK